MALTFQDIYYRYYPDYEPYEAFLFHAQEELRDISLKGKEVLEIGCGRGAFSLYMALEGKAKKVLALDESAGFGADEAYLRGLEETVQSHSIVNVQTMKSSIANVDFPEGTFDIIVANFSIHHVVRSNWCLPDNSQAQRELLELLISLRTYLKMNGMLVLREMSRVNFWRFMPYHWKMSHIDWEIHPTLREWLSLLNRAGFRDISCSFLTPYFLSTWPSLLVRNRYANFFFSSTFYLYGTK
jgi:SAM-dependent methyltransferase